MRFQRPNHEEQTGEDGEDDGVGEVSIDIELDDVLLQAKGSSGGHQSGEDPIVNRGVDHGQRDARDEDFVVRLVILGVQTQQSFGGGDGEVDQSHSQDFLLQRAETRLDDSVAQSDDDHQHPRDGAFQTRENLGSDQGEVNFVARGDEAIERNNGSLVTRVD